jgi:hypothetical protein
MVHSESHATVVLVATTLSVDIERSLSDHRSGRRIIGSKPTKALGDIVGTRQPYPVE